MILAWCLAFAAEEVEITPPLRDDQHPHYLDAADQSFRWSELRPIAKRTDVMGRVRRRRVGRTVLRVLFTGAAAGETYGTVVLVRQQSDWAWVLGAQAGLTALAAGLLWADIPRSRRIDHAEMLAATNAYLLSRPSP